MHLALTQGEWVSRRLKRSFNALALKQTRDMKTLYALLVLLLSFGIQPRAAPQNHVADSLTVGFKSASSVERAAVGTAAVTSLRLTDSSWVCLGGGMGEKPCTFAVINPVFTALDDPKAQADSPIEGWASTALDALGTQADSPIDVGSAASYSKSDHQAGVV